MSLFTLNLDLNFTEFRKTQNVLLNIYKKYRYLFNALFVEEYKRQSSIVSNEFFEKNDLGVLVHSGILRSVKKDNYYLCRGWGQIFPMPIGNHTIFTITDWPYPEPKLYNKKSTKERNSKASMHVFPTLQFKKQFFYHIDRIILAAKKQLVSKKKLRILDLCTGAGAYVLYLAAYLGDRVDKLIGIDINQRAVDFATFNKKLNGLENIDIANGDLFDVLDKSIRFDLIIANPPYVPTPPSKEKAYHEWGRAGIYGTKIVERIINGFSDFIARDGRLQMLVYSLGNSNDKHMDLIERVITPLKKNNAFSVSKVREPAWLSFNPQWYENPISLRKIALRFEREGLFAESQKITESEKTERWVNSLEREWKTHVYHLFIEATAFPEKEIIYVRSLTTNDLQHIMEVEEMSWPPCMKATCLNLFMRISFFPEGVIGCFIDDKLVGFATSQIINFYPSDPLKGWKELTSNGDISVTHTPFGNCLHLVSGSVIPEARCKGIWKKLIDERIHLAKSLGLKHVLVTSRIPSYKNYQEKHGATEIGRYAPRDYLVSTLINIGFKLKGLIHNCEEDPNSGNYCALLILDVATRYNAL